MQIKVGTHRVALIFDKIVIKFPRILNFRFLLKETLKHAKQLKFRDIYFDFKETHRVFKKGFYENWHERCCWKENLGKLNYLVPTKFSLIGLINFQVKATGDHITRKEAVNICEKIHATMKEDFWKTDQHTLDNKKNYLRGEKIIKLVDYGSLREFLRIRGGEFGEILNPPIQ